MTKRRSDLLTIWCAAAVALTLLAPIAASAQNPAAAAGNITLKGGAPSAPSLPAGLSPPVAPAVVSRDDEGRAVVRAVRIDTPPVIDGRLDDRIYTMTPPVDGFLQQVPREGAAATERTEAWVMFDDTNFYFSVRCYDREPERISANELRRDSSNIFNGGDSMTLVLDTLFDQRNGFLFQTNPLGAVREQQIADGQYIESWNTLWQVKSARFPGGWSTEMVIPFKSLRYREAGPQVWGINFRRVIRWKNEYAGLTLIPAAFGPSGLGQMQMAAPLVGLVTPARSRNIELKPYAVSASTTDNAAARPFQNRLTADLGGDFKYGVTRSLITDVTINTDFAQVEEDVQQVNLTRFNLLFPEKRDFFLEGQGIYAFGGRTLSGAAAGDTGDVPVMFFSRQIGLLNGQTIPVLGGARLTGKAGRFDVAALNIQTGEKTAARAPSTNFSALRLRRDILRRSNIGMIATLRHPGGGGEPATATYGADFSIRFSPNLTALGYYARAGEASTANSAASYRANLNYAGDRYGLTVEHLLVGRGFNPSVGYTRRTDFRRDFAYARFSPRLRASRLMRKLYWEASTTYDTDAALTQVQNRSHDGSFGIEFHSGDQLFVSYTDEYELLPQNFTIAPRITVPRGGYQNNAYRVSYTRANQRRLAGRLTAATGTLYNGSRREAGYSGRIAIVPQFALEPGISLAWVDIPYGEFSARLLTNRFTYTPTARLQISSLIQLNLDGRTRSASARLRWEYIIGSELFVVYSDGRDVAGPGSRLLNRSLAVKATRLLRF